jgi:serine/threonine-protein kinase TTK/MPS1
LIDFGIAKAIQNDETTNIHRESQVGTLNYMSPESILDSGKGANGALMKCGRVSLIVVFCVILYIVLNLTHLDFAIAWSARLLISGV